MNPRRKQHLKLKDLQIKARSKAKKIKKNEKLKGSRNEKG